MNQTEQDILKSIFSQLPEEVLPPSFQPEMMQRIRQEALRISKRNNRLRILALIAATGITIGLAVAALVYLGMPPIQTEFPQISIPPYYLSFGFLVLLLLIADHLLRQLYYKRREGVEDRKMVRP